MQLYTKNDGLLNKIYPVGSIYMSVNDVSPEEFLGGTWERWSQGRVPVGVDENDEDFEKPNLISGEKKHTLTKDEMAKHNHGFLGGSYTFLWGQGNATVYAYSAVAKPGTPPNNELCTIQNTWNKTDDNVTNVNAHNNLQPYITCYMWKRIA